MPLHELEGYMRYRQCSEFRGLSLRAETFGRAASDQDRGYRSTIGLVQNASVTSKEEIGRAIHAVASIIAALFLSIPVAAHAQTADPIADRDAIRKARLDYFEAYSRGDMVAVGNLISVPFMVQGQRAFRSSRRQTRHSIGTPSFTTLS
jgi:hypothetical protein